MILPRIYGIKRELLEAVPPSYAKDVSDWFDKYVVEYGTRYHCTNRHIESLGKDLKDYKNKYVLPRLANEIAKAIMGSGRWIIAEEFDRQGLITEARLFILGEK